jgi:hypothetical protein
MAFLDTGDDGCECTECKLRRAIFDEIGITACSYGEDYDAPVFGLTLIALAPTLGELMSAIDAEDCERWFRLCLEMRARAMDPEAAGVVCEGRA